MDKKRIRVLHFTQVINRNDCIDIIIRYGNKDKFEMMAASFWSEATIADPEFEKTGTYYKCVNIDRITWPNLFKGAWRLSKILRSEKIDILHTHHFYEGVMGMLACMLAPRTKMVFGRHYHLEFYLAAEGFKRKFYITAEKMVSRFAAKVIIPSRIIYDLIMQQGGVPERKVEVIHYGFDFEHPKYHITDPAEKLKKREEYKWNNSFVIGNFARHDHFKGIMVLLEAFESFAKRFPDSKLVLSGDGAASAEFRKWVKDRNLTDQVEFLGWRKDAPELMNLMDVIVHPTFQEAFAATMIEVMSLRIPLLITPVSGTDAIIKDNHNAFLIKMRSKESIEEKLEFVKLNPALALEIAENGRKEVIAKLSYEKIIPLYERVYESIIQTS